MSITTSTVQRDLTRAELRALVSALAAQPETWAHLVNHDPTARTYEQLRRDEHVAVWLICWMDDHDTGFHDHDVSCGALAVARGEVVEERLTLGRAPLRRRMGAGEAIDFAASDIHRVAHAGDRPAITINAYSPPLWRMGAYETMPSGELQRHSISYAEELRPLSLISGPGI
jgi:predicted metal-dependent enzyme (double-stranded beta helix superfamily)